VLSDLSGSGAELPTLAVLVITPLALGVTWIVTVVLAPFARVPRSQSTRPADYTQPADAPTNVTPAGSVSRMCVPGAALGPWLVTMSV